MKSTHPNPHKKVEILITFSNIFSGSTMMGCDSYKSPEAESANSQVTF
jgi:hypothetical protein